MFKFFKCFLAVNVFLFFFFISAEKINAFSWKAEIKAPTIISVKSENKHSDLKPIIKGVTQANTEVDIYINNIYQGSAIVNREGGETDNFYFNTRINLKEGSHVITAVAWDEELKNHSGHSSEFIYSIKALDAPTLIKPKKDDVVAKVKPLILGLTKNATFVHFFIDGVYNGKSKILFDESGTADFAYNPFLNLKKGSHIVWAVAEDEIGRKSEISNILRFNIEEPAVSPTLFDPVVNNNSTKKQPFIVGLAKNNHKIQIFINNKLNGSIKPTPHQSGITDFAYKPFLELKPGKYIIYAVAVDEQGKESLWSNIIHYKIRTPKITEEAEEDVAVKSISYSEEDRERDIGKKVGKQPENDEVADVLNKTQEEISTSSLRSEDVPIDVSDIIKDREKGTSTNGVVDENSQEQNRMQTNIIIFSLFLFAIIVWIFWVNKELIKEKKEVEKDDEN